MNLKLNIQYPTRNIQQMKERQKAMNPPERVRKYNIKKFSLCLCVSVVNKSVKSYNDNGNNYKKEKVSWLKLSTNRVLR